MIDIILQEIASGFHEGHDFWRVVVRLTMAMLFGAVIGVQRERSGKPAGVRTHMLVASGSALFVLGPMEFGMISDPLSRVIQGLITGIGFLGAGAILKLEEKRQIEGLTTAAGIWMTAGIGLAIGLGRFGLALVSVALAWFVLAAVKRIEYWLNRDIPDSKETDS
ncbi:MAG: MgtC/SapB family protein [Candidatus Binatia bacterium]